MSYLKQTSDKPLFPELLWSRPENKMLAGKLLIIGGNSFGFSAVGEAYSESLQTGVGEVRVLLPDAIQKIVGGVFEHAFFASSTPSGSLSKKALDQCLEAAHWADGVLIIGDVSRNGETAAFLELFSEQYNGPLIITKDALELLVKQSPSIAMRSNTALIMNMADVQLLAKQLKFDEALTFDLTTEVFVARLKKLAANIRASIVIKRNEHFVVLKQDRASLTPAPMSEELWRVRTAAHASVWLIQNPSKPFEALTTSLL